MAWLAVGVAMAVAIGVAALLLRQGNRKQDLGAVSGSWIAEHNARKSG
jgi:hypothetical protein